MRDASLLAMAATTHTEETRFEHEVLLAGLLGALAKLLVETTLAPLVLLSPWAVLRLTAAIVLGAHVASPEAHFGVVEGLVGLLVHLALSVALAVPLTFIVRRFRRGVGIAIGVAFGVAVYLFDLHVVTFWFPWFAAMRGLVQLLAHAAFGAVVALAFFTLHPPPTLEERAPEPPRTGRMVL
jgi:hypothetical protein